MRARKPNNISEFYEFVKDAGYDEYTAKVIAAVAAHETGNFKSVLYVKISNCFGFKLPKTWTSKAIGVSNEGYAAYSDISDSVFDFVAWCNRYIGGVNKDYSKQVVKMKEKGYFEDTLSNYLKGVGYWYNQI